MYSFLENQKNLITSHLRYNLQSPKIVIGIIDEIIKELNLTKYGNQDLNKKIEFAIQELNSAKKNANYFSEGMLSDMSSRFDLAATTNKDADIWYKGVIGTSEEAINLITRHLKRRF